MDETCEKFLELLAVIVDADGTWQEKKATLVSIMGEEDAANVDEFASWFDKTEEGA